MRFDSKRVLLSVVRQKKIKIYFTKKNYILRFKIIKLSDSSDKCFRGHHCAAYLQRRTLNLSI